MCRKLKHKVCDNFARFVRNKRGSLIRSLSPELTPTFIEFGNGTYAFFLKATLLKIYLRRCVFRFTSFDIFQYICLSSMSLPMYSRNLEIYRHVYIHVPTHTLSLRYTSWTSSCIHSPVHFNNSSKWYSLSKQIFSLRFILSFIFRASSNIGPPNSLPRGPWHLYSSLVLHFAIYFLFSLAWESENVLLIEGEKNKNRNKKFQR